MWSYVCVCGSIIVHKDHNKRVYHLWSAKPANLHPRPTILEVYDCMHTAPTVLVVWRAMLDRTPDCGDYYCWPHTYSCTHAGYKIFYSWLPSTLFLSCLLSTWNQFRRETRSMFVRWADASPEGVFPLFFSLRSFSFVMLWKEIIQLGFCATDINIYISHRQIIPPSLRWKGISSEPSVFAD